MGSEYDEYRTIAALAGSHHLADRRETSAGWVGECECGWASKPRPTRGAAWRSWNRHACNAYDAARVAYLREKG